MHFIPGSHLWGTVPHVERPLDGTRTLGREAETSADVERYPNVVRSGEVSLHSDLLLHGSPPNPSSRRRAGITFRYAAARVRPLSGGETYTQAAGRIDGGRRASTLSSWRICGAISMGWPGSDDSKRSRSWIPTCW